NSAGQALPTTNNFYYNPRHTQSISQSSARIDYTLTEKDSISGRYTYSPNTLIGQGPLATNIQGSIVGYEVAHLGGSNLSTSWLHVFNPTTINQFSFGFLSDPQDYEKGDQTDYASQFGLSQFLPSSAFKGLPHFQIGSVNLGSGDYRPLTGSEHNYQWIDNVTLVRGSHSLRIGADVRRTDLLTQNSELSTGRFYFNGAETRNPSTNSSATGDSMADFLLGYMSFFGVGTPILPIHKYFTTWAGYVNDTWHVRQGLTLTLGFRYELTTRWHADPDQYAMPVIRNGEFA